MFKRLLSLFKPKSFDAEPVIGSYFDRHPEHHPDKKLKATKPKAKLNQPVEAIKKAAPKKTPIKKSTIKKGTK